MFTHNPHESLETRSLSKRGKNVFFRLNDWGSPHRAPLPGQHPLLVECHTSRQGWSMKGGRVFGTFSATSLTDHSRINRPGESLAVAATEKLSIRKNNGFSQGILILFQF